MTRAIIGTVDNGRTGTADFPFYKGPVGIRQRGGLIEVAYRGDPAMVQLPQAGTLDGEPVEIVALARGTADTQMMVAVVRAQAVGG